jgi:hypothetical protein
MSELLSEIIDEVNESGNEKAARSRIGRAAPLTLANC